MNPHNDHFDVLILGAGAAGLMCAWVAAQRGKSVLVLEASNKPGKKILMSGGGRCNFTNLYVTHEHFLCSNPHFVKSALKQFSQWDFIQLIEQAGIPYHEKTQGQLFCDQSAKQVLQMLLDLCNKTGVKTKLNIKTYSVAALHHDDGAKRYTIATNAGEFSCASLVVATGGMSIPTLGGATGLGYDIARQFGLRILPIAASLVPFTLTGRWHEFSRSLSGVAIPVSVSTSSKTFNDDLLFTHRGLSGPAILQISNYWQLGEEVSINILPELDLSMRLLELKQSAPQTRVSHCLSKVLPHSLSNALRDEYLLDEAGQEPPLQAYRNQQLSELAKKIAYWRLIPSGTEGYRTAEVTRAGVAVEQISSKTFEVSTTPGLFIIGEVLDVTGHLGGFNFQWAWSSGFVAGQNV